MNFGDWAEYRDSWAASDKARSGWAERFRLSTQDCHNAVLVFARRATSYKRPDLLFADLERLKAIGATRAVRSRYLAPQGNGGAVAYAGPGEVRLRDDPEERESRHRTARRRSGVHLASGDRAGTSMSSAGSKQTFLRTSRRTRW